ncbi:PREDICTED: deoxyribonuclease gamma-like [Nanorana parkeri]|uniref:deoxyribonuclease gamma-like n=1 Tax=Nanorana parkeri TaxID=125878 RepID=UPI000854639F|nr:PREDICTED: deoxyribonuclease gamma-like [Nanorana parkeri]
MDWLCCFHRIRAKRIKIASFNVRRFGLKKCTDCNVFPILTKIILRYDIIVLLEVFDSKEKAAKKLVEQLNSTGEKGASYQYIISQPLGRSDYKEQYLFLYREDLVRVKEQYQYADMQPGDEDVFAREPFIIRFESKETAVEDFVLLPIHTTPKDSVREIDELYDVYLDVKEKWGTTNIMILGDFNADGSYVSGKKMKTIRLRSDKSFHWLITDDKDTTASNTTDHSYDRIVVHEDLIQHIVPDSAKPFNFQDEYKLTDEEALAVSDHYPVEVELKPI